VSDALASYCLESYECQPSVIPNGVRIPEPKPVSLIERLSLAPKRYFFMATRLVPHKNVHLAIEAHRLLAERRPDLAREYPLIIAGASSWTDTYARSLYTQATGLPFVRLIGERHDDELAALQMHAACHLSIASSEGMSIALLESGALARPAIVSDIPENIEVTGTLMPSVPVGDVQVLSDAMECAALMSDAERDNAGARFRQRVSERHDWERIAEMTKDVYQELLAADRMLVPGHAV
jgi:glycosyltransferase involved in cell wall biosynthesis